MKDSQRNVTSMRLAFWTGWLLVGGMATAAPLLPRPTGHVVDEAYLLSLGARHQLEQLAASLEAQTSAEMAVVTIPSLEGDSLEGYTQRLFQTWGIGKKDKHNGILILLARQERKVRIHTGYGVEGLLPDGLCGEIIRTRMVPYFQRGDFPGGLMEGAQAVASVIRQDPEAPKLSKKSRRSRRGSDGVVSLLPVVMTVLIFLAAFSNRGGRGGGMGSRFPWWVLLLMSSGSHRRGGWSGGSFGGGGGGFGGFGGGRSGGGGASGGW